ncbi:hypothetical protein D3C80_1755180 [compost metagenome]
MSQAVGWLDELVVRRQVGAQQPAPCVRRFLEEEFLSGQVGQAQVHLVRLDAGLCQGGLDGGRQTFAVARCARQQGGWLLCLGTADDIQPRRLARAGFRHGAQ